jgi:endonuclease G, mitochondrial
MPMRDQQRLKAYVARIMRPFGGIGALPERVEEQVAEEAARPPPQAGATESVGDAAGPPTDTGRKASAEARLDGRPLAEAALSAAPKLADPGAELTEAELIATEAIIIPDKRPAFDVVRGTYTADHRLWMHLNTDSDKKRRLEAAFPLIGRVELPGQMRIPYGGTGFVVGEGLLMTNRHVAAIFARGLGTRQITFRSGWRAGVDFRRERGQPDGTVLAMRRVRMIHPYWDMALLEVEGLPRGQAPLSLSARDPRDLGDHEIAVIGYPGYDPERNDPAVQNVLFDRTYGVKRLQPGLLDGPYGVGSFGRTVRAVAHDCSTLGGNSGSAVIDLETGTVLGVHFGGRYLDTNYAVPAIELARDPRVRDAGVSIAGTAAGSLPAEVQQAWSGTESLAMGDDIPTSPAPKAADTASPRAAVDAAGRVTFEVPLRITVELGAAPAAVAAAVAAEEPDTTERMREPQHDGPEVERNGYDPTFLGAAKPVPMPMPRAADPGAEAKRKDGGSILEYQNFSLVMHAKRHLALVTASNVTREARLRRPEPGRDYTRKGLGGLGKNDSEKWFLDDRLDARFQIPDVFFTRDSGAFDKGHIVRRDDVAWGRSYAEVRRANGDTFHVTNCSPQVAQFNQSARGEDNWGDLENLVMAEAEDERLSVFAGPVLSEEDETFVGRAEGGGTLRVKVPSRYWKVIVARRGGGFMAYGFVLEQDLTNVELEFAVPESFRHLQVPLQAIADVAGIAFHEQLLKVDTFDGEFGVEAARRGGLIRKVTL